MKLAEALQARADLNRRIAQLRDRLLNNALVQEGEKPAEDPGELLAELDDCVARLAEIIARINLTNAGTAVEGVTLTAMLARRDALKLHVDALQALTSAASQTWQRATGTEIRVKSAVDVRALRKRADDLSRQLRELDNRIQALNWETELRD